MNIIRFHLFLAGALALSPNSIWHSRHEYSSSGAFSSAGRRQYRWYPRSQSSQNSNLSLRRKRSQKLKAGSTHIVLRSAANGATLAFQTLPPTSIDYFGYVLVEIHAGRMSGTTAVMTAHQVLWHFCIFVHERTTITEITARGYFDIWR